MKPLATLYRYLQFLAHKAHNMVKGPTFFSDHDYLGSLYGTYEGAYDALVERMLGMGEDPKINTLNDEAAVRLTKNNDTETKAFFDSLLLGEQEIQKEVAKLMATKPNDGNQNLLQGLADESLSRIYKLRQRLA